MGGSSAIIGGGGIGGLGPAAAGGGGIGIGGLPPAGGGEIGALPAGGIGLAPARN